MFQMVQRPHEHRESYLYIRVVCVRIRSFNHARRPAVGKHNVLAAYVRKVCAGQIADFSNYVGVIRGDPYSFNRIHRGSVGFLPEVTHCCCQVFLRDCITRDRNEERLLVPCLTTAYENLAALVPLLNINFAGGEQMVLSHILYGRRPLSEKKTVTVVVTSTSCLKRIPRPQILSPRRMCIPTKGALSNVSLTCVTAWTSSRSQGVL